MRALSQLFTQAITRRLALSAHASYRHYSRLLITCLCLQGYSVTNAHGSDYADILQQAMTRLPPGSLVAAVIRDPAGNALLSFNDEQLLTPASTQKLLTATAAHYQLGATFRFRTRLLQVGTNDAVLQFSGDPLFTREDLQALLAAGIAKGMPTTIRNIYLDDSRFSGHDWSDAQSWDNRNTCFAAPAAAISLDHNCFKATVAAGRAGQKARASVARGLPITIDSHASIVSRAEKKRLFCRLELRHRQRGLYELHGCVTAEQLPLTLKVAVVDPVYYTRTVIKKGAAALGITITGDIRHGAPAQQGRVIAEHRSDRLTDYLERMLQVSDNQIADALFKTIGHDYYQVPGNYRNGAAAVRAVLLEQAEVDLRNSHLADGSGLSPHNQLSVTNLADTLAHIATMEDRELFDALPVAGVSGTLRYRYGFNKKPLKGNVRGKTGHLAGHYNLAGFLTDKQRQTLSFSIFVSGYSLTTARGLDNSDKSQHVRYFYESLFTALQRQKNPFTAATPLIHDKPY